MLFHEIGKELSRRNRDREAKQLRQRSLNLLLELITPDNIVALREKGSFADSERFGNFGLRRWIVTISSRSDAGHT